MRRSTVLLPLLLLGLVATPAAAQDMADLDGAWLVTSWTSPDGETNDEPQRGAFIFTIQNATGGSYSMMFAGGDEPRAEYEGESLTDAEKLEAYDSFTANTGRLTVDGGTITWEAWVAKDPNYMASWPDNDQTADWSIDDGILTLSFTGGFMQGATATLRRPSTG